MTRNPVIPYAITAVVGILLIVVLSAFGINSMNQEAGGEEAVAAPEEIFQQNCSSCHGGDLTGGMGPDLTKVGATYSADEIADIIQNGKGTDMPGGLVTGEAQQKLAEWLAEHK